MQNYNDYSREASRFLLTRFMGLSYYHGSCWTLQDISNSIGVTKSNLSNCRTGKSALSLSSFIKLCGLLQNTYGNAEFKTCISDMFDMFESV